MCSGTLTVPAPIVATVVLLLNILHGNRVRTNIDK
jgi:hypothetical protein